MALWLYLHFPYLQLDTYFRAEPKCGSQDQLDTTSTDPQVHTQSEDTAKEHPLVIIDGKAHQVKQMNSPAQQQGIQLGMGLGSASALCTELQVHAYDEQHELHALQEIAQWLYLVTSDICLEPPNGLILKVSDMLTLYGGLADYWQTLQAHLAHREVRYHFSTGFSPYCAMLLAKSGRDVLCEDKDQLKTWLGNYPIQATELSKKHQDALTRVGINTLNELLALPMQDIARRFDIDLVNYIGRLMGQFKHPLIFSRPPEQFQSHLPLLYELDNVQWLEKPLSKLLKKAEAFLTLRNQVAYEFTLTLHLREQDDGVVFTSASGDYLAQRWMTLCQLTMESLTLKAAVQSLTLTLTRSGPLESTSLDMFSGRQGQQTPLELIGLLQAKMGTERVSQTLMANDPRPELGSIAANPAIELQQSPHSCTLSTRLRPSMLLNEPQPLQHKVSIIRGPERISTGWWDGKDMTRDYYIARAQNGEWLWIFRNQAKKWFLHGQFC